MLILLGSKEAEETLFPLPNAIIYLGMVPQCQLANATKMLQHLPQQLPTQIHHRVANPLAGDLANESIFKPNCHSAVFTVFVLYGV